MTILSNKEIAAAIKGIPEWDRIGNDIRRKIKFNRFIDGIQFINKVAEIAEGADHHPDIDIRFTRVLFSLSTHSEGGITEKDFSLAKKIDELYEKEN